MEPKNQDATAFELFQAHFSRILNPEHALLRLADKIDWPRFDAAFADSYCAELGAPGKAIRLMVGLQYLKFAFDESDESVVDRWVENPYWQYFCGLTHMQHEAPIDPSSMSRYGYTLAETLEATESITGVGVTDVYVDKGYRGHGCDGSTKVHLAGSSSKNVSRAERKRRRRRSAIEPKIGHLKSDHRVRRCFLSGLEGDAFNIILAAAAANLRKLLAAFCLALRAWLATTPGHPQMPSLPRTQAA